MSSATDIRVLGIAGSLRRGSYNRALLRAAGTLLPDKMTLEMAAIDDIPLYNADLHTNGWPEPVRRLRERMAAADAILIASPEYNYSVPGVLKNVLDWVSRRPDPPLADKPAAIMGASTGPRGTARGQYHLRQVAGSLDMHLLNRPEVMIPHAQSVFDSQGELHDDPTRESVRRLLEALAAWTIRLRARA